MEAWGGAVSPQNSRCDVLPQIQISSLLSSASVFLLVPAALKLNSRLWNRSKQGSSEMTLCLFLLPSFPFHSHPAPSTPNTPSATTQAMFLILNKILSHLMARENLSVSLCLERSLPYVAGPFLSFRLQLACHGNTYFPEAFLTTDGIFLTWAFSIMLTPLDFFFTEHYLHWTFSCVFIVGLSPLD